MAIDNGVTPKNPVQQKFKPGDIADPKTLQKVQQKNASNQPILREQTLGGGQPGGNFYYGPGIQQGGVNSLVGSGAMAGMPNQIGPMNVPQISKDTNKMDLPSVESNYPTFTANENTGTTVPQNTKRGTGGAKGTNTQQQAPAEPEGFWENGVWYKDATDRNAQTAGSEFGGLTGNKEEAPQQEQPQQDDNAGEQAISQMESDLAPESGMIYGRATGDSSNPSGGIQTNTDEYSASYLANQGRVSNMNALQSMDSQSIAASIISGTTPYGSQAMRDLMQYNPQKYEEIQNAIKQLKGQNVVNGIASGNLDYTTGMNGQSNIANDKTDFALSNSNGVSSVGDILKNVNETLASNQVASTAQEQMGTIENDMINLQNRLKNLQDEARKVFKGDVPKQFIDAYVSNRTAEIQDQLSVLDQRYNAAYNRYQQEWEQTRWNAEMELKKQELEMKRQSLVLDEWSTRQGVELNWAKLNASLTAGGTSTTVTGNTVQTTSASRSEISSVVDNLVTQCQNGQLGNAQCAAGIQKNYLPYLGVDLGSLSAYSAKQGICNEDTSYIPQKGDLVVMSSPTQPQYGHIGIVTGVNGTTLEYLDWNGTVKDGVGTEKAAVRTTTLSNGKIYGYYNPTKTESSYYDPSYADIYGKYLTGKLAAGKQLQTQANAMGLTVQQLDAQAKAWKADQKNDNQAIERLNAIQNLIGSTLNRAKRISATTNVGQLLSGELSNWNADYKFVKDNITFDKLLELKNNGATFGALSDNELRSIGNAASKLNANMSDAEFKKTLVGIYNDLRRGLGEAPMSESEIVAAFNGSKNGGNGFSSAASGGYGIEKNVNNLYNM